MNFIKLVEFFVFYVLGWCREMFDLFVIGGVGVCGFVVDINKLIVFRCEVIDVGMKWVVLYVIVKWVK